MIKCKKMNISSIIPRLELTLKFPVISQRSVYNWFVAKTPIYPTPDLLPLRNSLSEPSEMLCSGLKSSVLSTKYNITLNFKLVHVYKSFTNVVRYCVQFLPGLWSDLIA